MKKTDKTNHDPLKEHPKNADNNHGELKTDYPLSEKDEIKQAEEKMRKAVKKPG
jgi:hypothetical protein